MDHNLSHALVILLGIVPVVETLGQCPPPTYFSLIYDWVLENHAVGTFKVPQQEWCQAHCIKDQRCKSFNYQIKSNINDMEHQCEISYDTKHTHPGSMKKRLGWVYQEFKGSDNLADHDINCVGPKKQNKNYQIDVKVNVAQWKSTMQSTEYLNLGSSSHAVDGNIKGDYNRDQTCTHTSPGTDPWWRVDLISCYSVTRIVVYNRVDCCSERLSNMEIRIGTSLQNNGNNNTIVLSGLSLANQRIGNYLFSPKVGRYVNIRLLGQNKILTLCEVQVFGVYSVCPT